MVTVLKLGGSVLTEKDEPETIDDAALRRASEAIGDALAGTETQLVLVHGGGSFGHHHAAEHGVSEAAGTHDIAAVADVHGAMCRLNETVLGSLRDADVPAVPVHPFSLAHRDAAGALSLPVGGVETLLQEGFTPVLHGDLVPHVGAGATVVSGDELVVALGRELEAERVGMCSTVPGVLDADGEVIPQIASLAEVSSALGASESTDVTGGMAGKVEALLDLAAPASIFDLDGLAAFLDGEMPGTRLRSDP